MEEKIVAILNEMSEHLSVSQMKKLQEVIIRVFSEKDETKKQIDNSEFLKLFLEAKKIEGCSEIRRSKVVLKEPFSTTE